ncbi:hypothetical protein [uncultured Draconibacterium sp.]|uniref:hypothetical protein n=1 Tax=uncultured Draconibacterium sp. TaxID=1573823 RepID=UPI0025D02857|nr:hypothetical protein [uncultured Draconibacterium sp.]
MCGSKWLVLFSRNHCEQNNHFENDGIYLWKSKDLKDWQELGKVFLSWNGGIIARLSEDLKELAESPRQVIPEIYSPKGWGEYPVLDKVGTSGAHIIKLDGKYCLVASDEQHRLGTWCDDLFLSVSYLPGSFCKKRHHHTRFSFQNPAGLGNSFGRMETHSIFRE